MVQKTKSAVQLETAVIQKRKTRFSPEIRVVNTTAFDWGEAACPSDFQVIGGGCDAVGSPFLPPIFVPSSTMSLPPRICPHTIFYTIPCTISVVTVNHRVCGDAQKTCSEIVQGVCREEGNCTIFFAIFDSVRTRWGVLISSKRTRPSATVPVGSAAVLAAPNKFTRSVRNSVGR